MRVPILGVAVAVALLLVENLGAIAYRELEQRALDQAAAAVAREQAAAAAPAQKREIEALIDQLEALERKREQLMNEISGNARRLELDLDLEQMKQGPRISAILANLEAASREVEQLIGLPVDR